MAGSLLLGIDIGTSSAKGVLCTPAGEVLASAVVEHGMNVPRPGWAEQDADAVWWGGFVAICRQLLDGRYSGEDVGAVGVSAIGPCMLPVDAQGRPLRPGVLYGVDTRASAQIAALNESPGKEAIFELSGQLMQSQMTGPKMRWFREQEPVLYARTHRILTASSYLVLRLTGEYVINRHEGTYSAPLFDLQSLDYDGRHADQVVPLDLLPRLAWSTEIAGTVTPEAAAETGLKAGTPVNAGAVDAAAEAVSVGVMAPGDLMIMYGSTLFFILVTEGPRPDPAVWATAYLFPGSYDIASGMATSGSLTKWFRDELAGYEMLAERAGGPNAYATLADLARDVPPGSDGLVALPYFSGERTPINDPDARGLFLGLTLRHTRGHLYRSLLEATAYGARHNLESLASLGAAAQRVVAVGGGVQNELWLQIMSDVTGQRQIVPEKAVGASYGDAFLAGLAAGIIPSVDALHQNWVTAKRIIEPDPAYTALYDEYFSVYTSLYPQTREAMHRLADLGRRDIAQRTDGFP
jgi:xylulokinase